MFTSRTAHRISLYIGLFFLFFSIYLAFFVPFSYFYTSFAIGTWLIFDFIDYRLNNTSILAFFFSHKHRFAFYFFFLIAFIFCFIVDYVWGVKVLKSWEWVHYRWFEYLRMYFIMNISFVLSIYEFYRVVKTVLKSKIASEPLLPFRFPNNSKNSFYALILFLGIIFLISPIFVLVFNLDAIASFAMIFPFVSISFITDAITYFTHGQPILEDFFHLDKLQITSLLLTVVLAFTVTEGMNIFGREWKYLRMPFYDLQILSVPISVIIGWIPLVVGLLSLVNMTKHVTNK